MRHYISVYILRYKLQVFFSSALSREVIEAVKVSKFVRNWNNQELPIWNATNDSNSR